MMRKGAWGALVISLGLGACAGAKQSAKDVGYAAGISSTASGVVTAVSDNTITVRTTDPDHPHLRFTRVAKTELTANGRPYDWTNLGEGSAVRVKYQPEAGTEAAEKIEVLSGHEAQEVISQSGGGWTKPERPAPPPENPGGYGPSHDDSL